MKPRVERGSAEPWGCGRKAVKHTEWATAIAGWLARKSFRTCGIAQKRIVCRPLRGLAGSSPRPPRVTRGSAELWGYGRKAVKHTKWATAIAGRLARKSYRACGIAQKRIVCRPLRGLAGSSPRPPRVTRGSAELWGCGRKAVKHTKWAAAIAGRLARKSFRACGIAQKRRGHLKTQKICEFRQVSYSR